MQAYYLSDKMKYGERSYESRYLLDPKYMTRKDLRHYYQYYSMRRNPHQCKKICIIIFCICFFCYIFVDLNLKTKLIHLKDRFDFVARMDDIQMNTTHAYFVNTPGCRIPYFPVTDDDILQFMFRPENIKCNKSLTRTSDVGTELWLNMNADELLSNYNISDLSDVTCSYAEFKRMNDSRNIYGDSVAFKLRNGKPMKIPKGIEFISVECRRKDEKDIFYKDFHFFALNKMINAFDDTHSKKRARSVTNSMPNENKIQRRSSFIDRVVSRGRMLPLADDAVPNVPSDRVSVMVFGLDSVSHLNFLRQMRRTASFIHENLSHVEFWGYNKVADNTYPNLIPVLTGLDENELNISCLTSASVKSAGYDECSIIWKRYKDAGYQTVYAEDVAHLSLFNYFKPGFVDQPTDYYFRPMNIELDRISYHLIHNIDFCQGGRRSVDVIFELIRKLIPYMKVQDFFSFFWTVTMTHDDFNMPVLFDVDVKRLFETLKTSGVINKTVVFFMSDHGMRFGSFRGTYQGMMEDRQPLMIALYPPWFKKHYPKAVKNLEQNANRLTSHYDLHATLMDLVNPQKLRDTAIEQRSLELTDADSMLPRGISLFLPIPATRTCDQAGIAPHWCTCHQLQDLPANDGRVTRAARFVVKLINGRLKNHRQCRTLYLNSILDAKVAATHHNIVKDITNDYSIDITLRIQTKPGLGEYEATVRMSSYSVSLTGTISRLNLYARQSYCIDEYLLKMFCYCFR